MGARIVREYRGKLLIAYITETEAYIGQEDLACHARAGRTPRTIVMYGPAGRAYVYFTYGNHWMLNVVTGAEGAPAAVLIRAIQPVRGVETIAARRHGGDTYGPGKLTQALGINKAQNGLDLTRRASSLRIEAGIHVHESLVTKGPRVGLSSVPEPWKSKPWRFLVRDWTLDADRLN